MDTNQEIRDFLTSRRARLTPQRAGLPILGRSRRVQGLRREEIALLAGISAESYTRLERGNARGVSGDKLESVSHALQLDEAEHAHLLDLVRTVNQERPPRRHAPASTVRPSVRRIVDAMAHIPAFVANGRLDLLYADPWARRSTASSFATRCGPRTSPASCSWTRGPGPSTPTGSRRRVRVVNT